MSEATRSGRTYNQLHLPRKYVPGKRRFSVYWTWSYPWEANRDVTELDNRFSTMTEVRRVSWPRYETPEWSEHQFREVSPVRWNFFIYRPCDFRTWSARPGDSQSSFPSALTKPASAYRAKRGD